MSRHAEKALVGVLVEGQQGITNLPPIAEVMGIDLIYLGMYDLSQSVGLAGELEHPKVMEQPKTRLKAIRTGGKLAGTFSRNMAACCRFREMGFHFAAYVADSYALIAFYNQAVTEYRQR
jgi:2-keto-3-deoxy-L-rhamnonate aldolase RhmA